MAVEALDVRVTHQPVVTYWRLDAQRSLVCIAAERAWIELVRRHIG